MTEDFVAKRTSKRALVPVKKRVVRTRKRTAKGPGKVTAIRNTSIPAKPPIKAPKNNPAPTPTRAEVRESWLAQQQDAAAAAKSQHGALVDERALTRATSGHRWAARKTR